MLWRRWWTIIEHIPETCWKVEVWRGGDWIFLFYPYCAWQENEQLSGSRAPWNWSAGGGGGADGGPDPPNFERNLSEIGETWEKAKKNLFVVWWRWISGQQSEKIAIHLKYYVEVIHNYFHMWPLFFFLSGDLIIWCSTICIDPLSIRKLNVTSKHLQYRWY